MAAYTPTTPEAFNCIRRDDQREKSLESLTGLRYRSAHIGGHYVRFCFDDDRNIVYVDRYVDQYNRGADEWICAFGGAPAEKVLDDCLSQAESDADEEGYVFDDMNRANAYMKAANKLLMTLPDAQVPKSMRQKVKNRRESW